MYEKYVIHKKYLTEAPETGKIVLPILLAFCFCEIPVKFLTDSPNGFLIPAITAITAGNTGILNIPVEFLESSRILDIPALILGGKDAGRNPENGTKW